mgnify:CR=1 FL=1
MILIMNTEKKMMQERLLNCTDSELDSFLKKFNINLGVGPVPYDSDERLMISVAMITDVSLIRLVKALDEHNDGKK